MQKDLKASEEDKKLASCSSKISYYQVSWLRDSYAHESQVSWSFNTRCSCSEGRSCAISL